MSRRSFQPFNERVKPEKPYPEFPLYAHRNGCWAKRIRGKIHYFGKWEDPQAALDNYLKQKDDLHAGRKPREDVEALTVKEAANRFLNHKQALVDAGELSPRTWREYKRTCDLLVSRFGKGRLVADLRPDDFTALRSHITSQYGHHRTVMFVTYTRSVFKFLADNDLVDRPVRMGGGFRKPAKEVMRRHRASQGPKLFTRDEVLKLLDGARLPMRAWVLLGINAGFGNTDCASLPLAAVDLDDGWVEFPRPKTGVARRCPLWTETVDALRAWLEKRPAPGNDEYAGLLFLTRTGAPFGLGTKEDPIGKQFSHRLGKLGIGRKGMGFYTLRHTFRTVADEARDQPAADYIMGHESGHMSSHYRERISDQRLRAVADHVRAWLFGPNPS